MQLPCPLVLTLDHSQVRHELLVQRLLEELVADVRKLAKESGRQGSHSHRTVRDHVADFYEGIILNAKHDGHVLRQREVTESGVSKERKGEMRDSFR